MKTFNVLLAMMVLALGATQISCNVNDYCLNCDVDGDGGMGSNDDANDGGGDIDAEVDAGCVVEGGEICDGKDNDCNGLVDDGVLPGIGVLCTEQDGECAGGVTTCATTTPYVRCSKLPMPESCDFRDNDCDDNIDEGDPGGGAKCGTDVGDCVAGTLRCQSVANCDSSANCTGNNCCIKCVGFTDTRNVMDVCNGRDDNCNGMFDENLTNLGACTWPGATNEGACNIGTLLCVGGGQVCGDMTMPSTLPIFPKFELCNGIDDDCDTGIDEIFNKQTDPNNCLNCGTVCATPSKTCINGANAKAPCTMDNQCMGGTCVVNSQRKCTGGVCGYQCNVGYKDLNLTASDGCEYKCAPTGNEECDNVDNDCDGMVDEMLTPPPNLCRGGGECGNTAPAATCMGAQGWTCTYPGAVEFPEVSCDNKNNDCDANTDESHPDKNANCNDNEAGVCLDVGTRGCNMANPTGPTVCNYTTNNPDLPFGTVPAENCNNRDDDCDGNVDEGATLVGLDWVDIGGGRQMMKYEASKPDALGTDQGNVTNAKVCSRPGVQPWTNITYPQAVAACARVGATLCAEPTWHRACSDVASTTYPVTGAPVSAAGTRIEAEDYASTAHATGGTPSRTRSWVPDYTAGFSSISGLEATPNSTNGNVTDTNASTQAPRLTYSLNFPSTSMNWHVWVKLFHTVNNANSDTVYVELSGVSGGLRTVSAPVPPTPVPGPDTGRQCTMDSTCTALYPGTVCQDTNANALVDTCVGWVWVDAGTFNVTATGQRTLNIYMGDDGVKIDQIYIVDGSGTPPTTLQPKGGTWAFANGGTVYDGSTCNGADYDTGAAAGNQDDILATGALNMCYSNVGTDVYDLSGNVKEWTLAHQPGENPIRGGASNNTDVGISCPLNFTLADDQFFFPNIGFRCCK